MSIKAAYVTLLTKDEYLPGTLVLDLCLKQVDSKYPFVVFATKTLSQDARDVLQRRGIHIRDIESLKPLSNAHTLAAHDARFAETWSKLRWGMPKLVEHRITLRRL